MGSAAADSRDKTSRFIGIPSSGSAGLINLISRFTGGHIVAGVFCALATAGWALEGLAFLWMYKNVRLRHAEGCLSHSTSLTSCCLSQVWAHSHGEQGHSFAQAKQEIQMCKQSDRNPTTYD